MLTDFLSLSGLNQAAIYLEKCQIFLQRFLEIFSAIGFHFKQKRLALCNYKAYYLISYVGMDNAYNWFGVVHIQKVMHYLDFIKFEYIYSTQEKPTYNLNT